ncbi:hypothetical protein CH333_06160 [candidate division WOR-3 bacterium JGI_Cruoil_03_44_89]|uniref:RCK C-terminal domain-containing protein n=1 Tax=candidate division WOR-3 bacterium JGI_Cruoil_03_44_89 TaxID=1973748 RepID=A0A235BSD8_UNCW3|nr:MAG: hypothetical protein CH333_06160 [candidate division WOR-3 bacterium JGI_Cruoil_03_44_89]
MKRIRSLKETLIRMRDLSDLMVELGYSAILQDDIELTREVNKIKREIRELTYEMRVSAIYAAKGLSKDEIPQVASLLQIGVAVKEISDGIDDMVEIVARGVHPVVKAVYRRDTIMKRMIIEKGCRIEGKSLEKAKIPEETGFMIRAIRRGDDWIFEPGAKTVLKPGDIIFLKGKDVAIRKMTEYAKTKKEKTAKDNK